MKHSGLIGTIPLVFLLLAATQTLSAQTPARAKTGTLVLAGDAPQPATWKVAELKTLPRTSVTATQEDGRKLMYEGVLVGELLKRAGAITGAEPRGAALTTYVLAVANDGYQVLFSLSELDSAFSGHEIIVADTVDGKPLADSQGPLRIVPPRDTRGARSVRMVERLEVVRLRK
jgi:DMSO/TMAO reductase YedYZ molybdopterin-dependent catalytic subunit